LSVSKNGGQTFDSPVKINDDEQPASHGMHSMAIDDKGRIFSAWLDERNIKFEDKPTDSEMHHDDAEPNSEVFYSVSEDGGKTFAANEKIASDVCPCCKTAVLAAPDGTVILAGDRY
jgi:Neuraminidase (sialidase)